MPADVPVGDFRTVTHATQSWRYFERGTGDPIVLLHGFPDTPQSWATTADAIAGMGRRAIVPYLRGYHRDTFVDGRDYGAAALGGDVIGLLDALDIDRATLVGHDWGASAAYRATAEAPDRIAGLVPIAVPHPAATQPSLALMWDVRHFWYLKAPGSDALTRRNDFALIDTLYERWAPQWLGPARDAAIARVKQHFGDPDVLHAALQYYRDLSLRRDPANRFRIGCPALLIAGGDDFAVDAHRRSLERCDGPAELMIIEGAAHWPHREEEPRFIEALLSFLATTAA